MKSYAGTLVAALALLAACSSNKPNTQPQPQTPPSNPTMSPNAPPASSDMSATGAPDAKSAVKAFLDAGKAQDLQALSAVWGSANGPLRNMIGHDQLEKRELIIMCFLKHDSDQIGNPSAAPGSRVIFPATLSQSTTGITRTTTITAIVGPQSRWYVETIDLPKIEALCQKQPPT